MERVLRAWAQDAAEFAHVLAVQDPSWGSGTLELGGGMVVVWGAGLYVNRALAVGLDVPLTTHDFERIEAMSAAVGVEASMEVSPATHTEVRRLAESRGYAAAGAVAALRRRLDDVEALPLDSSLRIDAASGQLSVWQETSAIGWRHQTTVARRASDAYAAAAAVVDGHSLLLARNVTSGHPVGCAGLARRDAIATLGGMTTIPAERGRGVQAALIRHRLRAARAAGCEIATTTTKPGGASERNLLRCGFERWFTITTLTRRAPSSAG